MTDPTIIAAALVTVIAALVAGTVTIVTAVSAARDRLAAIQSRRELLGHAISTEAKTDTVIAKAVEIHTLTNSNLSAVTAALATANSRIEGLNDLVRSLVEQKRTADALASVTGAAVGPQGPAGPAGATGAAGAAGAAGPAAAFGGAQQRPVPVDVISLPEPVTVTREPGDPQ